MIDYHTNIDIIFCLFLKVPHQGTKLIHFQSRIADLKLNKHWAEGINGPGSESTGDEHSQNLPSFQRGNVLCINIWSLLIERICTAAIPGGYFKHCSHMGPLCLSPCSLASSEMSCGYGKQWDAYRLDLISLWYYVHNNQLFPPPKTPFCFALPYALSCSLISGVAICNTVRMFFHLGLWTTCLHVTVCIWN